MMRSLVVTLTSSTRVFKNSWSCRENLFPWEKIFASDEGRKTGGKYNISPLLQICKISWKETFCTPKIHGNYHRKEIIKESIIIKITNPSFFKNCVKLNWLPHLAQLHFPVLLSSQKETEVGMSHDFSMLSCLNAPKGLLLAKTGWNNMVALPNTQQELL